jgi:type II secretory pathway pseudopilin PulG
MRPRRRALTLTELLTVASVIAILASMLSPLLVRGRQVAVQQSCASNLNQMFRALTLYANGNNGKFPRCFDTPTPSANANPIESTWWYRKISMVLYPLDNTYSFTRQCPTCSRLYPATAVTCPLHDPPKAVQDKAYSDWLPHRCVLRCPASHDPFDHSRAPAYFPGVAGGDGGDKDRVFDDCYGYNNLGTNGYGFVYAGAGTLPAVLSRVYSIPYYSTSKYYHDPSPYGANTPVTGRFMVGRGKECPRDRTFAFDPTFDPSKKETCAVSGCGELLRAVQFGDIGTWSDFSQAASTLLMADYCKADASPFPGVDEGLCEENNPATGKVDNPKLPVPVYGFRHGGKFNALFAAGNVEGFTPRGFFSIVGTPKAHWQVYR